MLKTTKGGLRSGGKGRGPGKAIGMQGILSKCGSARGDTDIGF